MSEADQLLAIVTSAALAAVLYYWAVGPFPALAH